jgi:hypothetical protein
MCHWYLTIKCFMGVHSGLGINENSCTLFLKLSETEKVTKNV